MDYARHVRSSRSDERWLEGVAVVDELFPEMKAHEQA
jgi:hypothetical protein